MAGKRGVGCKQMRVCSPTHIHEPPFWARVCGNRITRHLSFQWSQSLEIIDLIYWAVITSIKNILFFVRFLFFSLPNWKPKHLAQSTITWCSKIMLMRYGVRATCDVWNVVMVCVSLPVLYLNIPAWNSSTIVSCDCFLPPSERNRGNSYHLICSQEMNANLPVQLQTNASAPYKYFYWILWIIVPKICRSSPKRGRLKGWMGPIN